MFKKVAKEVNVPLAEEKTVLPSQVMEFLGLELDTIQEVVRLPQQKIDKCKMLIEELLNKSSLARFVKFCVYCNCTR